MNELSFKGFHPSSQRLDSLTKSFRRQCAVSLRSFANSELVDWLQSRISFRSYYQTRHYRDVGRENTLAENPAWNCLHFLMNDPRLFDWIQLITGTDRPDFFSGRIYQIRPDRNHYLDWHNDMMHSPLCAFSLNLSPKPFEGGRLEIRRASDKRIVYRAASLRAGDATLFKVNRKLQHRLTPLTGVHPRIAYAGWFFQKKTASWFFQEKLKAR